MDKITTEGKEIPLHRLSLSITSISLYLSLNHLSHNNESKKRKQNTKERRRRTTLTYTKEKTPAIAFEILSQVLCRAFYRQRKPLEDETRPHVKN